MSSETFAAQDRTQKIVLGMPVVLFWGYIAIALFMTGDGIEQAFLAKYVVDIGFTPSQASMLFTVYGATAALSSWLSGVLSEVYGPRRIMTFGVALWLVLHTAFLYWGLGAGNYPLMLLFYGLRGFAYPLFFYAFFVWVVQKTPDNRLASATGWIWAMFTIGYGIVASYLPSWTIPAIGFMGTLWMSMIWVLAGGVLALWFVRDTPSADERAVNESAPARDKLREISRGMTLIFENRNIGLALIIRIICNLSLFGFPVIMPLYFTSDHVGFTTTEWLRIWGTFFVVQPLTNVMWGIIGDRIGWMRQMRWVGFVGCGIATLLFYYLPYYFPHSFPIAILVALLFALTVTSFVAMGAIFPMIEPDHKGAAISVQNLGGGLSNFCGPAIATLLLSISGTATVVIVYGVLYFLAAILTLFIRVDQPMGKRARDATAH